MTGRFHGLLLEDKRPLRAKLHTAHVLRQQKFYNARPRLLLFQDTRPEWQTPQLTEIVVSTVRHIQHVVCEAYGISLERMLGRQRTADVLHPRQVAMYLCRQLTRCSLPDIGRRFGRDHTCVLAAMRKIGQLYQDDKEFRQTIDDIKGKL